MEEKWISIKRTTQTFCRNTNCDAAAAVTGYKVRLPTCTGASIDVIESKFCLSAQDQVTLLLFFVLIKCQQRRYLTQIWGQLKLCFNPCCCELHPNVPSAQVLSLASRLQVAQLKLSDRLIRGTNATNQLGWKYDDGGGLRGAHGLRFSTGSFCSIAGLRERLKLLTQRSG